MKFSELPKHIQEKYGGKVAKRSKYNAERTDVGGIKFDSKKEAHRFWELGIMMKDGIIERFHRQVIFDLPGGVKYLCDFMVIWDDGHISYEDVKGVKTAVYRIKKKQVEEIYGVKIEEL